MLAKFIDGELTFAPRTITIGLTYYNPTPKQWLDENGYKPVVYTAPETPVGCKALSSFEEQENVIKQIWTYEPLGPNDEIQNDEIIQRLEEIL